MGSKDRRLVTAADPYGGLAPGYWGYTGGRRRAGARASHQGFTGRRSDAGYTYRKIIEHYYNPVRFDGRLQIAPLKM